MKRLALIALVCLPLACASQQRPGTNKSTATSGRGEIKLTITPSPVVAASVSGSAYDFPFDAVVKETGGHPITIDKVTASVYAGGGIPVAAQSFDADKIKSLGFATSIQAKHEIHYHLVPRMDVTDDHLFSAIYGDVRVEGLDDNGARVSSMATITVTKK
ncbi:MAG TPA: hypothetical protein VN380_21605 [Thermoanaerobaculia bacterium]|jgi:hypothetical protein|nr:hypothetical protein [Thermoanaerobaculia bacterium]